MLDEHEAHVFEYCRRLAGDESDAASATQTAMIAAQSLLADPGRLRAWLFALARQELVTRYQPADQDQDDEIRDLVHLHGIRPEDLPAVLGVTAEQARVMLADAEAADAEVADAEFAGADGAAEIAATVETGAPAAADGPAGVDGLTGTDELTAADGAAGVDGLTGTDELAAADGPVGVDGLTDPAGLEWAAALAAGQRRHRRDRERRASRD